MTALERALSRAQAEVERAESQAAQAEQAYREWLSKEPRDPAAYGEHPADQAKLSREQADFRREEKEERPGLFRNPF